jgi:membrane associated rhomboid family serine protease
VSAAAREENAADVPVWARGEAFPAAPAEWGWLGQKGDLNQCKSFEELAAAIRDDPRVGTTLVWMPDHPWMRLPEEIPALHEPLRIARDRWSRRELASLTTRLAWAGAGFFLLVLWSFSRALDAIEWRAVETGTVMDPYGSFWEGWGMVLSSNLLGVSLLICVIFALIPWYQARQRRAQMVAAGHAGFAPMVPALRFEIWLEFQRAPVTRVMLGMIAFVWLAQLMPGDAILAAGLLKDRYAAGEWWRLLTAPFLHGNLLHFLMNGLALAYLGKRLETFARWPHLALVFLFAAVVGGEASARLIAAPTVGASGGLMGWLGFLLVFETLHSRLVPRSSRKRLAVAVLLTALLGVVGYRFIDNAAHAGGLIAGMIYAAVVFPKSASVHRPRTTKIDLAVGIVAMAVLMAAAGFTIFTLLRV